MDRPNANTNKHEKWHSSRTINKGVRIVVHLYMTPILIVFAFPFHTSLEFVSSHISRVHRHPFIQHSQNQLHGTYSSYLQINIICAALRSSSLSGIEPECFRLKRNDGNGIWHVLIHRNNYILFRTPK